MLRELVKVFQDRINLPIEIDEVRDEIIDLHVQDKIIFSSKEMDTGKLRGVIYQWHESAGMYAEATWTTLIVYPSEETVSWQRAICAKELVHVCDRQVVKTTTPEMVEQLARKILGPFETNSPAAADVMAAMDKLAQYQFIDLLFPKAARELARQKIAKGDHTEASIADWVMIPEEHVKMALSENWEEISEVLVLLGNGH